MEILTTQAALRNARHVTGQGLAWKCGDCGKVEELGASGGCGTGYGYAAEGPEQPPICYDCCSKRERARMIETGKATLYLSHKKPSENRGEVTDWPGTMRFGGYVRQGRHNMAGRRYDIWFTGPDGEPWHGVQYGDNTQLCHCKRVKRT